MAVTIKNISWQPPVWWCSPEAQLALAAQIWPNTLLPKPPKEFVPRTETEILLLHVPSSFDFLWDKVNAPEGYTKIREKEIKSNRQNLRLAFNTRRYIVPVWLAFDPEYGKGIPPELFWDDSYQLGSELTLAASEVLSAMIQFPEWCLSWHGISPILSGYQSKHYGKWSHVPYLCQPAAGTYLLLEHMWADELPLFGVSPSVRGC